MNEQPQAQSRKERFRIAIADFIRERKEAKLKDKDDDTAQAAKYDYETWLADAARRASQIQIVTHVLKATHPDARGASLHAQPSQLPVREELGTHDLARHYVPDVVGNAAALDVFKLLKLEVDGRPLLDWMRERDSDLAAALNADDEKAAQWMQAFGNLLREQAEPGSHNRAKQIYWLTGDSPADNTHFHLLQPMFSSVLAHAVHQQIQQARFGDDSKEARKARRADKPHEGISHDYPGLVARKLGGTKPQNISQLNSERGGTNYLLASLPPRWKPDHPRSLLGLETVFDRLTWFRDVRREVKRLATFLREDPPANDATRQQRRRMEQELGLQLAVFGAQIRSQVEPGWTRHPDCQLPVHEQLWLDPERAQLPIRDDPDDPDARLQDTRFQLAFARDDWADQVADDFAGWVNSRLHSAGLTMVGGVERRHWARQAILDATAWPVVDAKTAQGVDA